ncbi:MAG: hypothetical protein ACI9GW_000439 [Halieaceae bacterium]
MNHEGFFHIMRALVFGDIVAKLAMIAGGEWLVLRE